MKFEVTILGSNSALPAHGRNPTCQIVNHDDELYMIDCGEGAQVRMNDLRVKRSRINNIFISHLHGDHVYGLPGFMNSLAHADRKLPLHIYGPKGIAQLIDTVLRLSSSIVQYDIVYHELTGDQNRKVFENDKLKVNAFPLKHRVPTYGFLFEEQKRHVNVLKSAISEFNLSIEEIRRIKQGPDKILLRGKEVPIDELAKISPGRRYAYCSDTIYDRELIPIVESADLMYHEATFMHELEDKAILSKHTTAMQAGMIARLADVRVLLIGHFSSRYKDLEPLLLEAREMFQDTELAIEGKTFHIGKQ